SLLHIEGHAIHCFQGQCLTPEEGTAPYIKEHMQVVDPEHGRSIRADGRCAGVRHASAFAEASAFACNPTVPAYTSCARQHSAVCPGFTVTSGGFAKWHWATASAQRGAKGQPSCST